MAYFLVRLGHGPAWDAACTRRDQADWSEHAAFMDALVERGIVLFGGPVGNDVDSGDAMLVVAADHAWAASGLLSDDPWNDTILTITGIERWTLWLRPPARRLWRAPG